MLQRIPLRIILSPLLFFLFISCTSPTSPPPTNTPAAPSPTPIDTSTPPPTPTQTPDPGMVLVGAGDISSCLQDNDEATAKLLDGIEGTVFTTGDNAYPDGTVQQFADCYGPTWGRHKSRTEPVPGNHDYHTEDAEGYFEYFNRVPEYYVYTLGSWRIYALNTEISVSEESPQVAWLQEDLAANPNPCVLAYWHKPRWSSGLIHGNSSRIQTLWEVLYEAGAELVINGHEHNYERFAEMDALGSVVSQGLREIVVGTGGQGLYHFGSIQAGSEVRNDFAYGVLKVTLHETSYDWQFISVAGETFTDSGSSNCH